MGINNASINWQDIPPERWRELSQFMRDTSASQALRPYTTYDPDLMAERAIEFSAPAEETRFGRAFAEKIERSGLILVSHSPALVRRLCTRAAVLDQGILTFYDDLDEALATYNAL
jgi:hypothetical protein